MIVRFVYINNNTFYKKVHSRTLYNKYKIKCRGKQKIKTNKNNNIAQLDVM